MIISIESYIMYEIHNLTVYSLQHYEQLTKCFLNSISDFLASSSRLAQLMKFWVGWEMLPPELNVEISGGNFPTASTCFETLKLPARFQTYQDFEEALISAINSAHTGFGLV